MKGYEKELVSPIFYHVHDKDHGNRRFDCLVSIGAQILDIISCAEHPLNKDTTLEGWSDNSFSYYCAARTLKRFAIGIKGHSDPAIPHLSLLNSVRKIQHTKAITPKDYFSPRH